MSNLKPLYKLSDTDNIYVWDYLTKEFNEADLGLNLPFDDMSLIVTDQGRSHLITLSQLEPEEIVGVYMGSIIDGKLDTFAHTSIKQRVIRLHKDYDRDSKLVFSLEASIEKAPENKKFMELIGHFVTYFLIHISDKKIIIGTREKSLKIAKKKYITRRITYVTDTRYISEVKGHRDIDWTHCFKVCGHWRKINGVGKNRKGEYCINGFTWISPYEKNKELPKIEKLRLVK